MRIRKAVFPAAGLGTRFLPATKAQPKVMLPLVDKPIIQYVVEEARDSGIEQVIFVTGRGQRAIEDHFDISFELEHVLEEKMRSASDKKKRADLKSVLDETRNISNMVNTAYVRQKEAKGLGHAILAAKELVGNEPFAVLLGDDVIYGQTPCLKQMIDAYSRYRCPVIALERIEGAEISRFGVIEGHLVEDRLYKLTGMVEKPSREDAPSDLAIIGRYILTPEIFEILDNLPPGRADEIQLTDGLVELLQRQVIYGYEFEGRRYDAGDKLGFLIATVEYGLRNVELRDDFRAYLQRLDIATVNGTVGAVHEPPSSREPGK
ncbi:MAG: UTP--glucose-1-phosphate uridylyltransferase GalU [Candidatus Coatesbacteria bacterium]|nr:UTP--glucose-1-phosphate uridylyltransferase GalU [Candidatus Coatesbacteria bacterium]